MKKILFLMLFTLNFLYACDCLELANKFFEAEARAKAKEKLSTTITKVEVKNEMKKKDNNTTKNSHLK